MHRPRLTGWRGLTWAVFVAAGTLFVTSSLSSHGLDLRAASVTDLDTLVRQQRNKADSLQKNITELNNEIGDLTRQVGDSRVTSVQRRVAGLQQPAGLEEASGPGLTVTLTDTPREFVSEILTEQPDVTAKQLIVHQQDIQAVVNALWAGGAEAMTVQGQRIISTTGIKCVGNTVVLHGVPYAPPYKISAIGDPDELNKGLDESDYVAAYRSDAPILLLGYDNVEESSLRLPAYEGSLELRYARPATAADAQRN